MHNIMQTSVDIAPMQKFYQGGGGGGFAADQGGSDKFSPFQPVGIANVIVKLKEGLNRKCV